MASYFEEPKEERLNQLEEFKKKESRWFNFRTEN